MQVKMADSGIKVKYLQPAPALICHFTDFEVKELSRRASGQAFEVILSPSSANGKGKLLQSPLKKKETSLDDIKKKLEAAEERRKVSLATGKL